MIAAPRAAAASRKAGATITQPAFEAASCLSYCGLDRKAIVVGVAASSGPIEAMRDRGVADQFAAEPLGDLAQRDVAHGTTCLSGPTCRPGR